MLCSLPCHSSQNKAIIMLDLEAVLPSAFRLYRDERLGMDKGRNWIFWIKVRRDSPRRAACMRLAAVAESTHLEAVQLRYELVPPVLCVVSCAERGHAA